MKKNPIIFLFISLIFGSCGLQYHVITRDATDGSHTVYLMNLNKVLGERTGLGQYGQINIDAEYYKPAKSFAPEFYSLIVSSITFPGLQIQTDSSFILKTDSTVFILSSFPDRYFSKPIKMAGVHYLLEKATFEIDENILEKIGSSKSVSFIVKGRERNITGNFSTINISRFKSFYEDYVE